MIVLSAVCYGLRNVKCWALLSNSNYKNAKKYTNLGTTKYNSTTTATTTTTTTTTTATTTTTTTITTTSSSSNYISRRWRYIRQKKM
jgi:hypothetical protein